jgi:Cu-Zn family superoxide dismutase
MRPAHILVALLGLGLALPAAAQQQMPQARGNFINAQGQSVGTAALVQTPNGVLITLELRGLPPGLHAFHIHQTGRCDANGGFQTAGGHYNPGNHEHGYMVQGGAHAGDMPNQFVGPDGVLRTQVLNDKVTIGSGDTTLFDSDGSALVLHAQPDDYRSQPAGDAGGRIACAVIERQG